MAKKTAKTKTPPSPPRRRAKRLPAAERKATILTAAAAFFAKHGFSGSTRDLADAIEVRQALIYKYFADKEDLIRVTLETVFAGDGGLLNFGVDCYWSSIIGTAIVGTTMADKERLFLHALLAGKV